MNDQVLLETKLREWVRVLRVALGVLVAVAAIGVVALIVRNRQEARSEAAYAALFNAERLELDAANEAQALKSTPEEAMKKWPAEKKKEYEQKISVVVTEHSGTAAGAQAALKLGRWKFEEGRFEEALGDYQRALKAAKDSGHELFTAMAFDGIATSQESLKKYDDALKTYADALALKNNPLKALAYLGQARAQTLLQKPVEAKAAYDEVIKQFPNSRYERQARALQALLPGA